MTRWRLRLMRLGITPYREALSLQHRIADGIAGRSEPETLLVLEHRPVVTLGQNALASNVLLSEESLAARRVELVRCDRGGDVTFHGPGQLVAYPLLDLRNHGRGVRQYVSRLEEIMILCLGDFGLAARRKEGMIGVWLGGDAEGAYAGPWRKIGAAGVRVSRWITTHGLSLNVSTDLSCFRLINPCGITAHPVTSMAAELSTDVSRSMLGSRSSILPTVEDVTSRLIVHFGHVFDVEVSEPAKDLTAHEATPDEGGPCPPTPRR